MWSLTDVDRVPLTCLLVLEDTSWCSEARTFTWRRFSVLRRWAVAVQLPHLDL